MTTLAANYRPTVQTAPSVRADSGRTYRLFFLCGHPKSGTNWVSNVLNLHPKINCQGEFRFEALRRAFDSIQSHWWHVAHHEPARSAAEECFRDSVKRIMAAAAGAKPDATWIGDRTPRCVRPFLPGAPNILVLRDPRDILVSWAHQEIREAGPVFQMHDMPRRLADVRRRFLADPLLFQKKPHALFADEQWVRLLARRCRTHMNNDLDTLARAEKGELDGPVRVVRYERLHADPEGERSALYEFLNLDPAEAAPLSDDTNTRPGFQREDPTRFYRKGRVGDWRLHFSQSAKRWFLDEAGDLLVRLEYEPDNRW